MSLDRLLGSWTLTMNHSQMPDAVTGHQHYERVLDGAFVQLRWSYEHPDFPDAIALFDEGTVHYFDVRGVIRVFDFSIDEAGWSMTFIDDRFSQRATARFDGPDVMQCEGEASDDRGATWRHDYSMTYVRQ